MLRKGLAVAVILLFIGVAFIPNVSAYDKEINDDIIEPLDIGRTIIRGFGLFPIFWGDNVTFFAIRLSFIVINGTDMETVTIRLRWITLPKDMVPLHTFGLFRMLIYIFGVPFNGSFEPPDSLMRLNNQMRIGS